MIFGIPGSGKSTFAVRLGHSLHLPVYHLDKYFYVRNWQERETEDFLRIQKELVEKETWIIDGNSTKTLDIRFSRADLVLYFRYNRLLCLWRIFKRLIFKDHRISDRAEGCKGKAAFRLIRYLWGFDKRVQGKIQQFRKKSPQTTFYELRNSRDLKRFEGMR
jgi:adenylate kinase family enzyme